MVLNDWSSGAGFRHLLPEKQKSEDQSNMRELPLWRGQKAEIRISQFFTTFYVAGYLPFRRAAVPPNLPCPHAGKISM
jgi:hypothetical protein